MAIVRDETAAVEGLAIVEKYEAFVDYIYPIAQRAPRRHGVARDAFLTALFAPVEEMYAAAKSRQASRLYALDARLATLRFWLRFMVHADRKVISRHQHQVAARLLAEPSAMLGAWIKRLKESSPRQSHGADAMGQAGK